jgi:hypothetical protein
VSGAPTRADIHVECVGCDGHRLVPPNKTDIWSIQQDMILCAASSKSLSRSVIGDAQHN